MKYIIQIIGGLGLLLMLNMCVQAGMLSHANIQNSKEAAASSSQSFSSDSEEPKVDQEFRERNVPATMPEGDPAPEDYGQEPSSDF